MKFLLLYLLLVTTALAATKLSSRQLSKLSPRLQRAAARSQQEGTFDIFVDFTGGISSVLQQVESTPSYPDRTAKITVMRQQLLDLAAKSQAESIEMAVARGAEHTSFWISNQLFVKAANFDLLRELSSLAEVEAIDEEQFAYLEEPVSSRNATPAADHEWSIRKIQAPEAWAALGNNNGKGVVVATVDTGVRVTHEALRDNYYGTYGWFDPSTVRSWDNFVGRHGWLDPSSAEPLLPLPKDNNGHGTHATGTIAGKLGIGVAPGAEWMACRGCASFFCSQWDLLSCAQFVACPTLADGSAPDCSKAPHIVANTWASSRGSAWFYPVIDVWSEAGIIPVFSVGNAGPECSTASSPGDHPKVIAVGSTTMPDAISSLSSAGPAVDGRMKPDISAPGSEILSACHTADDAYASLSGATLASPHVAGAVALLLARDQHLPFEKVRELLVGNAERNLSFSGRVCDGIPDNQFPNHVFGAGRLNILRAVNARKALRQ